MPAQPEYRPQLVEASSEDAQLDPLALAAAVEAAQAASRRVRRGAAETSARIAAGDERVVAAAVAAYLAQAASDDSGADDSAGDVAALQAGLLAALQPFADAAELLDRDVPEDLRCADEIPCEDVLWRSDQPTVGALRRAAELRTRLQAEDEAAETPVRASPQTHAAQTQAAQIQAAQIEAAPSCRTGELTFAIGDLHGRFDLLQVAAERILAKSAGAASRIIFLGDYVDRGPQSREVIEFLIRASAAGVVCLKGNHEEMMLQACRDRAPDLVDRWMSNGGDATLMSYGATRLSLESLDLVPDAHLDWLEALPTLAADEHRIYVHAGLVPGIAAEDQADETRLWIRERFLRAEGVRAFPDGKHVVHGHTPAWAGKPDPSLPELLPHRSNLDTAAFYSGVLTVGVFDAGCPGGPVELIRVGA